MEGFSEELRDLSQSGYWLLKCFLKWMYCSRDTTVHHLERRGIFLLIHVGEEMTSWEQTTDTCKDTPFGGGGMERYVPKNIRKEAKKFRAEEGGGGVGERERKKKENPAT